MSRRHWSMVILAVFLLSRGTLVEAQKILPEGVKDLATQIASNVAKDQKRKIAVLPFRELDGRSTVLGTYLAEELVTDLFNIGNIEIVERTMLDKILGELRLGQIGLIDPETAKKVGKIAGVDAVVTGTITDLQSYVAINCRLIDTQTGRIFGAAQTRIVKDDDVKKIIGVGLSSPGSSSDSPIADSSTHRQSPKVAAQRQEEENFLFELRGCSLSGTSVRCDFVITNRGEDRTLVIFASRGRSRIVDNSGDEYVSIQGPPALEMASGVPMRGQVVFGKVSSEIRVAKILELHFFGSGGGQLERERALRVAGTGEGAFRVQFRDVAISRP